MTRRSQDMFKVLNAYSPCSPTLSVKFQCSHLMSQDSLKEKCKGAMDPWQTTCYFSVLASLNGRNPAPADMENILSLKQIHVSQLVQIFSINHI